MGNSNAKDISVCVCTSVHCSASYVSEAKLNPKLCAILVHRQLGYVRWGGGAILLPSPIHGLIAMRGSNQTNKNPVGGNGRGEKGTEQKGERESER